MRRLLKRLLPDHRAVRDNRWLRPFQNSLLHPRLWHLNRHSAAGAIAAGLFCGLIPGPFQMLGAAICALIFRINLPLSLFTTLYTNPLTIIPLYVMAYEIGGAIIGNGAPFVAPPDFVWANFGQSLQAMAHWMLGLGKPLLIGLPTLATILALGGYFLTRAAWRIYLMQAWHRRKKTRR